ncbi:hypothetical protein ENSA5_26360 [Enhygromyxa salina]|uniref:Uncharacterized protein n=1 Tax=Enhygromyxa salina TaxID=215803 RepID=A0A2S9YAN9_9BACT|nr:hypothetical protein [Enhygromyxa salina]PRQ02177.1 hypothetical protein ENSA5_26360 [Enhygromyxa salina]
MLPYVASSGIAASVTVLALMLNLLGLSRRSDADLSKIFYRRVQWIGRQASAMFVGSLLLLLTLAFPAIESDAFDGASNFVVAQFYVTSALTAVLSGLAVSMVLMLQSTLSDLVAVLGMKVKDHYLLAPSSDQEA